MSEKDLFDFTDSDGAVVDAYGQLTIIAGGESPTPGGGIGNSGNLEVEQFDVSTQRWSVVGDMRAVIPNTLKFSYFSLAAANQKIFCFGGIQGANRSPTSNVFVMDVTTKEWIRWGQ